MLTLVKFSSDSTDTGLALTADSDKDRLKFIYWTIVIAPFVFLNLLPYIGIDFTRSSDSEGSSRQLMYGFSLGCLVFVVAGFASYKCIRLSEIVATRLCASFALLLYVFLLLLMAYFYMSGKLAV